MAMSVEQAQAALDAARQQVQAASMSVAEARRAERKAAQEAEALKIKEFRARMFAEFAEPFALPEMVFSKAFALAWEHGHDGGLSKVECHMGDFAELARASFEAGIAEAMKAGR